MIAPGSPTVRRRRLAAELRGIRESKGKSGDTVAAALKWSPSKISRYERAKTGLRPREVERLLDYYGVAGQRRTMLLALAEDASQKGWWEEYADSLPEDYQQFIGLEHEATAVAIWHDDVVSTEQMRSGFIIEGERETHLHRVAFRVLTEMALSPAQSKQMILDLAETLWTGRSRTAS